MLKTVSSFSSSSSNISNVATLIVTSLGNVTLANANISATTTANATFATSSLPLVPAGYISILLNGTTVKIPYYAV